MTRDGSDFGYLLSIETDDSGTLSLSGSGQIDGGKLNGTYKISQDDTAAAVIEVKDYDTESAKEGYLNGNYTITFPADSSEDTDSSLSMLENFALVLDLNSAKDSGSVALSVESAGSTLGSFTVTSGAGESVEIPDLTALGDVYDVTNEDDMSAYAATLDLTTLMDNLFNAGVPDEVITLCSQRRKQFPMPKMLLMKMPQKQSLMLSLLKQAQPDLAAFITIVYCQQTVSSNTLSRLPTTTAVINSQIQNAFHTASAPAKWHSRYAAGIITIIYLNNEITRD